MKQFSIGTWVIQRRPMRYDTELTWGLIVGHTKRGKTEAIVIGTCWAIAAKKTLTAWYPLPESIDIGDIPQRMVAKILKKKHALGY